MRTATARSPAPLTQIFLSNSSCYRSPETHLMSFFQTFLQIVKRRVPTAPQDLPCAGREFASPGLFHVSHFTFQILLLFLLAISPRLAASVVAIDVGATDRARILKAADAGLTLEPITITKFRAKLSDGGPNDFYSNGDYWWPNPDSTNGLPYVQRDGQTNPENFIEHRRCVMALRDAVAALGAAYKITGEDRYAKKAAELLRVFF